MPAARQSSEFIDLMLSVLMTEEIQQERQTFTLEELAELTGAPRSTIFFYEKRALAKLRKAALSMLRKEGLEVEEFLS